MAFDGNVGQNNNSGVTTITVSPTSTINVGDLLIVRVGERDHDYVSTADNSTQAGTANSYAKNIAREGVGEDMRCFIISSVITRSILTSDTVTVTFSAAGGVKDILLSRLTNPAASPFNQSTNTRTIASSTGWDSTSITTTQPDELVVGVVQAAASSNDPTDAGCNPNSPWVEDVFIGSTGQGFDCGSQVLSTTQAISFQGLWGVSMTSGYTACIASYKIAGGAPPPPTTDHWMTLLGVGK